jgi:adenine/guanine phosphoribosyltransferase-like PRPP-binding protein
MSIRARYSDAARTCEPCRGSGRPQPFAAAPDPSAEFAPTDLLNDFGVLAERLRIELDEQRWLDAFLLAAGSGQVIDDYRRRGGATLRMSARFLAATCSPAIRAAGGATRMASAAIDRSRACLPRGRRLEGHRRALADLTAALAPLAMGADALVTSRALFDVERVRPAWARTLGGLPPGLRGQVLRLPACFRSFDQHPADVRTLARAFARRWPDRLCRVVVVGVRTSGSYLAPLCAAALGELGYSSVVMMTVRPDEPLLGGESASLREVARAGGMALLLDDPPVTGRSVAAVARRLRRAGLPPSAIVPLIARCEARPETLPALAAYPQVTLAGPDWRIVRALRAEAVECAVRGMLPVTTELTRLRPHASPAEAAGSLRGHLDAAYTADLFDHASGRVVSRELVAEGVGLGYFGRHAVAVGRALLGWVPMVYGFADGILVREATSPESTSDRVPPWADPTIAEHVAEYVLARHRALPSAVDGSVRVAGQCPAWEVAAGHLCAALGRPGMPLRIFLVDPILRRLLTVTEPMIIDGRMYPDRWRRTRYDLSGDRTGPLVKELFAEGAFNNRELFCYDPVFDVAGASVHTGCARFNARLREHYEARSGQPVPEERWLIYQIVHFLAASEADRISPEAARRGCATAIQRYFASLYLGDVTPNPAGPFCALDLDGVLEISPLGFSMTTRAGAMALRALLRHGYQPLVATGRNLEDVRDRCENYRLAGGVAEYGALLYQHHTDAVTELVSGREVADLARLRDTLTRIPGVRVDPGHRLTLRTYREIGGSRRGLAPSVTKAAMRAAGVAGRVQLVPGDAQTDFVAGGVDKAIGLRHLLGALGGPPDPPLAFAVGDGPADAGMLAVAEGGFAPGNAAAELRRRGVNRTRASYQAGLARAVGSLLGHPPGGCGTCRAPTLTPDARALVALLSVAEAGAGGMPGRLARLTVHAADARWLR